METRTWVHPITKETEEVEVGSDREKELKKKMNDAGMWAPDDPDAPEGLLSGEELDKFLAEDRIRLQNRFIQRHREIEEEKRKKQQ